MLKLNIKNLWIQPIGDVDRNITSKEIKITNVDINLEGNEIQFYERIMEKIERDLEEKGKKWQEKEVKLPQEWDINCEIPEKEYENDEENNLMDTDEGLSEELSELEDEPKEMSKRDNKNKLSGKVKELIQDLETPVWKEGIIGEEENSRKEENSGKREIKELIKMFHKMGKSNKEQIWDCYQYGRNFEQKVEEIKNQSRKRITVQTARGKVYEEMRKQMVGYITKSAIRKRTQRAIKVYELFTEIGRERINWVKNFTVGIIEKLNDKEIQQVKEHFRNKSNKGNIQMEE